MAGRLVKARPPYLFRAASGPATGEQNICRSGSRVGEIDETSERLTPTNVAAAWNGLGGHSHARDMGSGALEAVRWPGSYIFV
jgi:hypothetical protein